METDSILMCLIAFVLGYLVARMIRGNGLMVGGQGTGNCNFDVVSCMSSNSESITNRVNMCEEAYNRCNNYDGYDCYSNDFCSMSAH
jgi:hypothetical protein